MTRAHLPTGALSLPLRLIIRSFQIIIDTAVSDTSKLRALKFFGHWVGDVHQPLYVSFKDDRGGNLIKGTGPCEHNLHAVWDDCIVETKLGTDIRSMPPICG